MAGPFYSRMGLAFEDLPQTFEAASLMNRLAKSRHGMSMAEWAGTYMDDFVKANPGRVSRDKALKFFEDNQLDVYPLDLGSQYIANTVPGTQLSNPKGVMGLLQPDASYPEGYREIGLISHQQPHANADAELIQLQKVVSNADAKYRAARVNEQNTRLENIRRMRSGEPPLSEEETLKAVKEAMAEKQNVRDIREVIRDKVRNSREVLAARGLPFIENHFPGITNIEAHLRMSDRNVGPTRAPSLHVDELQSGWHQAGSNVIGYSPQENQELYQRWAQREQSLLADAIAADNVVKTRDAAMRALLGSGNVPSVDEIMSIQAGIERAKTKQAHSLAFNSLQDNSTIKRGVPRDRYMPRSSFQDVWQDLGMKYALYKAAEADVPFITWNRGEYLPHIVGSLESGAVQSMNKEIPRKLEKILRTVGGRDKATVLDMDQLTGIPNVYGSAAISNALNVYPAKIRRWMNESRDLDELKQMVASANRSWPKEVLDKVDWKGIASRIFENAYKADPGAPVQVNAIALPSDVRKTIRSKGFSML